VATLTNCVQIKVVGDSGSSDILEKEARESGVVICKSILFPHKDIKKALIYGIKDMVLDVSNNAAMQALLNGLEDPGREKKSYYIHASGALLILDCPDGSKPGSKIWDDVPDIDSITSMYDAAYHRKGDKVSPTLLPTPPLSLTQPPSSSSPSQKKSTPISSATQ
jgi:hypothetical protein